MTRLTILPLADGLTVSAQPGIADFSDLAALGVTLVVNDRPDGEEPDQLSAADAGGIARANGMDYRHIPVKLTEISAADVTAFGQAVADATGPVHAHCRTGIRAATLWALNEVMSGRKSADEVQATIQRAGFDPKTAHAWLAAHAVPTPP